MIEAVWTGTMVKNVLVDSYALLRRSGGRVGPGQVKGFWPADYKIEQGDFVQQSINKTYRHQPAKPQTTAKQQSCMEIVVLGWRDKKGYHQGWLSGPLLLYPDFRSKLIAWTFNELSGSSAKEMCRRRHWSYATMKRHRDGGAKVIADRLNRLGVTVW